MNFSILLGIFEEASVFLRLISLVGFLYLFAFFWSLKRLVYEIFFAKGLKLEKFQTKSGAWAIITGASEGIGREFSLQLSERGFNVVIISRSKDKLKSLSQKIENTYATRVIVHTMDFSKSKDKDYDALNEIIKDLDVKILATLRMTKLVIPGMIRRKSGLILTMGSFSGIFPTPLLTTYSGSKAFLTTWSQALAEELKPEGIIVQLLNSYFVVSSMSKIKKPSFFVPTPKLFVKTALQSIGLKRGASTPYTTTPYPSHSILNWFLENIVFKLSRSYFLKHNLKMLQKIRNRALQKQSINNT
ncbi:hypothetical protein PMAC_000613 [Pneumocystis sp. 'macacae']|nr:hypothetical protein PMAC_000613 [Pneumocystis sp. 'macacae']